MKSERVKKVEGELGGQDLSTCSLDCDRSGIERKRGVVPGRSIKEESTKSVMPPCL